MTASVELDVSKLGVWTVNNKYVVEAGEFEVMVGVDSESILSKASFWVK